MQQGNTTLLEKVVSLAKRRGFIFPGSEIYGGLANSWDYGPLGVELKNNIKQLWWNRFVHQRDDIVGIDAALIMNPKVWEASGHVKEFSDPLVECKKCKKRIRWDDVNVQYDPPADFDKLGHDGDVLGAFWICENCATKNFGIETKGREGDLREPLGVRQFNLMLKTFLGPVDPVSKIAEIYSKLELIDLLEISAEEKKMKREELKKEAFEAFNEVDRATAYFRPETAQSMFVNFKNVLDTTRKRIPFGIAQMGKAFRNEITPGNFIFRTREFEQMEIEYFVRENEWEHYFGHWQEQMKLWIELVGIDATKIHEVEIPQGARAHYSKRTIDFEYEFPFGQKELYGLAYRGNFDLKNHQEASGQSLMYRDPVSGEEFLPHTIEPTWGVDRTFLAVLLSALDIADSQRVVLKLDPKIAPIKVAVFPLLANKPDLVAKAKELADALRKKTVILFDERGNIGKRYYAQDEIGTPWCLTVDFQTLEDESLTVRFRDTAKQERVSFKEARELKFMESMI